MIRGQKKRRATVPPTVALKWLVATNQRSHRRGSASLPRMSRSHRRTSESEFGSKVSEIREYITLAEPTEVNFERHLSNVLRWDRNLTQVTFTSRTHVERRSVGMNRKAALLNEHCQGPHSLDRYSEKEFSVF